MTVPAHAAGRGYPGLLRALMGRVMNQMKLHHFEQQQRWIDRNLCKRKCRLAIQNRAGAKQRYRLKLFYGSRTAKWYYSCRRVNQSVRICRGEMNEHHLETTHDPVGRILYRYHVQRNAINGSKSGLFKIHADYAISTNGAYNKP